MSSGNQPGGGTPTGQSTGGGLTTHDRVERDLAALVNGLIRLAFDVGASYESALHRIDHPAVTDELKRQEAQHGGHIAALSARVRELGDEAASSGDGYRILDEARIAVGQIAGTAGILSALKTNIEELRDSYHAALENPGLVPADRNVIEAAYYDCERQIKRLVALAEDI